MFLIYLRIQTMANNRLLIYCKECFGFIAIAKYYPVMWAVLGTEVMGEKIENFMEEHQECLENYKGDLSFDADIFCMTTESTWKGYISYNPNKLYKNKPDTETKSNVGMR